MSTHSRGRATGTKESLARRHDIRPQKKVLLVVTAGDTEANYIKELKAHLSAHLTANVTVFDIGTRTTVRQAVRLAKACYQRRAASPIKTGFEQVWLVLDREPHEEMADSRVELEKLLEGSSPKGRWHVAGTNPCIEYWFLLHFHDCKSPFETSLKCLNALRKVCPTYAKPSIPRQVLELAAIRTATQRALGGQRLPSDSSGRPSSEELRFLDANPSTGFHLLVNEFLQLEPDRGNK